MKRLSLQCCLLIRVGLTKRYRILRCIRNQHTVKEEINEERSQGIVLKKRVMELREIDAV